MLERPAWRPDPKPRTSTPPAAPLQLPVLRIEELTSAAQRFRCVPYAATLTARTCVERQRLHGEAARTTSMGNALARRNFGRCAACADGKRVMERVGKQ